MASRAVRVGDAGSRETRGGGFRGARLRRRTTSLDGPRRVGRSRGRDVVENKRPDDERCHSRPSQLSRRFKSPGERLALVGARAARRAFPRAGHARRRRGVRGGGSRGGATDGSHGDDPHARGRVRLETHVRLRAIRGREQFGVPVRFRENIDCVQDASVRDARLAVRDERFAQNAQSARGGEDAPADFFSRRTTKTKTRFRRRRDARLALRDRQHRGDHPSSSHARLRKDLGVFAFHAHALHDVPSRRTVRGGFVPLARDFGVRRGGAPAVPRSGRRGSRRRRDSGAPRRPRDGASQHAGPRGGLGVRPETLATAQGQRGFGGGVGARALRRRRRRRRFQISPRFVRPRGGAVRVDVQRYARTLPWEGVPIARVARSAPHLRHTQRGGREALHRVRHARRRARRRAGRGVPDVRGRGLNVRTRGKRKSVPARAETRHVRVATWRPRGRGASHVSR